jgi:catechol 2,3-dioxygenase-like lactoylglutathione lyase family enzyme
MIGAMKLNHLNLCVADLGQARSFFEEYFDFELLDRKGDAILVMSDRDGFTLVISDPTKFGGDHAVYPEGFHVGFLLDTAEQVDATYARLTAGGLRVESGPRDRRGGYGFYFRALGGMLFEVSVRVTHGEGERDTRDR